MRRHWLAASLLTGLLAACSGGSATTSEAVLVRESSLAGDVPSPDGKVVLAIEQDAGPTVEFDVALLERLRTVEATVREPFLDEDHLYTGVMVDDLFAAVGAASDSAVTMTALDDYVVSFAPGELASALLATREDGEHIEVVDGGPIRIVFLPSSVIGRNEDVWIWSVRTMLLGDA